MLLSSAIVYGAWANNPVPITEDAPLRPNPGVVAASEKAELERTAAEWRDAHPAATVAILRPTVTVSADGNGWLARALARSTSLPVADEEPPAQFLDVDDLAVGGRPGPPRAASTARATWPPTGGSAATPCARSPVARRGSGSRSGSPSSWRGSAGDGGSRPRPPSLLPFTVHPWVIANDRLKADGWEPASSNEEAYVGAHRAGPWATLSPRRRQELALGGGGRRARRRGGAHRRRARVAAPCAVLA